MQKNNGEF